MPETNLLGESRARGGIAFGNHRIVRRQSPFCAILFRGHVVFGVKMPFERFEFQPVFKTDDVVGSDGFGNRHRRLLQRFQ